MSAGTRLPGTPTPMHLWPGAGGVRIAGDSWGDPAGPLVILQHGGGQTRHAWKGAGETLGAAGYFAVAFDARGHGDSDWAPDGEQIVTAGADLTARTWPVWQSTADLVGFAESCCVVRDLSPEEQAQFGIQGE